MVDPSQLEQLEYRHWNLLDHVDPRVRKKFLTMFDEYINQLPKSDQILLRTHYLPITRINMRMRTTLAGISKTDDQVLEDAVRELCAGEPEQKIIKIFNVLNKAFKYTEPRFFEMMTGRVSGLLRPDICVPGSNCHYKREFLINWVKELELQKSLLSGEMGICPLKITTYDHLSSAKAISPINLGNLEKIKIIDLVPNIVCNNKVIFCTMVVDGILMGSFHTVVEDEFGQCGKLCINNITTELQATLKTGVKIAIANPYYKIGESDQCYFIRVESPEEIVVLDALDNSIETYSGDEHKMEGNKYFTSEDYERAIRCYTRAIATGDPHIAVYYSNRAICYFKKFYFENSLHDAEEATKIDPQSSKYQTILALVWSALGDYQKSVNILSGITPNDTIRIAKEKKFLANSRGEIDLEEIAEKAISGEEIEIADFIGPVEITTSPTKGHCIVCSRDIKKEEVISITKAIAYVGPNKQKIHYQSEITILADHISPSQTRHEQKLFESLANTIIRSKLSAFRIFSLYNKHLHGPIQIELYGSQGYDMIRDKDKPTYQTQQIRTIIRTCAHNYTDPNDYTDEFLSTSGLWFILAYMNHSCCPNTFLTFYKDVCIIRANCNIPAGTELTAARFQISEYEVRSDKLLKMWNYKCDCKLCKFESDPMNEALLNKAKVLREKVDKITDQKYAPEHSTLGDYHYKFLDEAFSLAEEMQLGKDRYNGTLWQTIHSLISYSPKQEDYKKFTQILKRCESLLCDSDLEHQKFLWWRWHKFNSYNPGATARCTRKVEDKISQCMLQLRDIP